MKQKEHRCQIFMERFRELQGERSNTEFAEILGMSRQTVGFYCNGDRVPDALGLRTIAEKCNVSADWLLGLSNTKSTDADVRAVCDFTKLPKQFIEEYIYVRDKMGFGNELINCFITHPGFWDAMCIMYAADALPPIKSGSSGHNPDFIELQKIVSEASDGLYSVANTGYLMSGMLFEIEERLKVAITQSIRHGKDEIPLHGYVADTEILKNRECEGEK